MRIVLPLALLCVTLLNTQAQPTPPKSNYRVQEFMVPMRDGVHLQTVVISKANQTQPLPILLTRTPYGVLTQEDFDKRAEKDGADWVPDSWKELAADGYIFVWQNLRGRFKSEGDFLLTSRYDPNDPKQANETNDAYDTVDWLIKNVPNNNGKVGIYGVSYNGLTAGADPAASASRAQGHQRAGLAGRSVDERRRSSLRSATRELRLRIRGDGASGQKREHPLRFRHLRHLRLVLESGPPHQSQ